MKKDVVIDLIVFPPMTRCCSCCEGTWFQTKWDFFRSIVHDIVDNPFFEWTILLLIFASRSPILWNYLWFLITVKMMKAWNQPSLNIPYLQSVSLLWRYQPARQWGVEIHPQDCQPCLCRPLHNRDVSQVDRIWSLEILWKRLDLPRLHHCHCKWMFADDYSDICPQLPKNIRPRTTRPWTPVIRNGPTSLGSSCLNTVC